MMGQKMLIKKGKSAPSEPWKILEVSIGQAPDIIAARISRGLQRIHEKQIEALIPFRNNSSGEPEWIIEHVYVRGANGSFPKLARIPGIARMRHEVVDQEWIEALLAQENQQTKISVGQFVRVLTGPCAMMCGNVTRNFDGTVSVSIQMRTKAVTCYTYPQNVQAVDAPMPFRNFFYSPALFS